MEPWQIVLDILILLTAALALGTVAEMLRQSALLGYLVAGTVVGPNVLGLVGTGGHVDTIAELGAAVLLFTIGLEFSIRRLRRLGRVAVIGGCLQVTITLGVAAIVGTLWLPVRGAVAVGAMVALSSTACVVKMLMERRALESIYGRNSLGILLFQDAAVIPLMLLVLTLGGAQGTGATLLFLGKMLLMAVVLAGAMVLLLNFLIPRLLTIEQWARNRELPILLAIILAIGSAAAAHGVSLPAASGAFVAGVLLGGSPFAAQIRADVASLRTVLVTLFFASIGMLGEPMWVAQHWHLVTGVVVLVVIGKLAVVWAVVRLMGYPPGLAAATGLCLAQVGEFSFVLAEIAHSTGDAIIDEDTFRLVVSVTIVTLFCTPFLVIAAPRAAEWLEQRRSEKTRQSAADADEPAAPAEPDIVIVGFGPAGQAVANALYQKFHDRLMVIELNPRNARTARGQGLAVRIGDATRVEVLESAGIEHARVITLTIPDPDATRAIIQLCRRRAPDAAIIARSRYHVRRWEMELAGAREVIDEEEHVGLRIAATARKYLAADEAADAAPRDGGAAP